MRFKIEEIATDSKLVRKEFLFFPMKFNGYRYWLEFADVEYCRVFGRWSRFGKIIKIY